MACIHDRIYALDEEERYSVYDPDGRLIAEMVDVTRLLVELPDAHEIVTQGIADEPIMMLYDRPVHVTPPPVLLHNHFD